MSSILTGLKISEARELDGPAYDRWLETDPAEMPRKRKAERDPEDVVSTPSPYHDEEPTYSLKNFANLAYSKDEGSAPNGKRYNATYTYSGEPNKVSHAIRSFKDNEWGAKEIVDIVQDSPNQATLYVVDNHKYGMWKPWKDQDPISKPLKISEETRGDQAIAYNRAKQITKQFKYDTTVSDIIVQIKMLAENNGISEQELEHAVNEVHDAHIALESAIYGLDEAFKEALDSRYALTQNIDDTDYEINESNTPANLKEAASLLESIMFEDSTAMNLITNPAGTRLLKDLLRRRMFSHDQKFEPLKKVKIADLKDTRMGDKDTVVLFQGSQGAAVLRYRPRYRSYEYYIAIQNNPDIKEGAASNGTEALSYIRNGIGNTEKIYIGKLTADPEDKVKARYVSRRMNAPNTSLMGLTKSSDAYVVLYRKFRPLFKRAIEAAIADIKGIAGTMIKNGAYERAKSKISKLHQLEKMLRSMENTQDTGETWRSEEMKANIRNAVHLAAHYYYPTETGDIIGSHRGYSVQRDQGIDHLISDLGKGDLQKLSAIIAYFKQSLIA